MENEEMSKAEFKTLMEMVVMILESCENLEEAIDKIKGLTILNE